jgi:RNA polymerase sigma-70 factor (ECF subfamily)
MGLDLDGEAELLARVADGDGVAFGVLYDRYLPLVLRWSLRETRNRELAADLTAEVFAASLLAARRYRKADVSVGAWLLGIARNKLRESRRKNRIEDSARRKLGFPAMHLHDADLEHVDELVSVDARVLEFLDDLPDAQRHAVVEHVVNERSYGEIAQKLCCSESVVRQRVSRGLRTLRSELGER